MRSVVVALCLASPLLVGSGCNGSDRDSHHPPLTGAVGTSGGPGSVTSSSSGGGSGSGGGGGQGAGGPTPDPSALPKAAGPCPKFESGPATITLPGLEPREVLIRVSRKAATLDGPFVVVYRSGEQTPDDAIKAQLGTDGLDAILDLGGVVVAPDSDPIAGAGVFPWFTYLGAFEADGQPITPDDFRIVDQLLACAIEAVGVDTSRIHAVGYHEGSVMALHTAILRSGFVASVVAHSTAVTGAPAEQDATNVYPAMLLFGGSTDNESLIDYGKETPEASVMLSAPEFPYSAKHFTILCEHGGGTMIANDAVPSTVAFLLAHPYRIAEEPYAAGLPKSFPSYCEIVP
ncbi:MAG: hypothetical protein EXR75_07015 [Myxococcales bacterium]|nr:hypothetical protein [Myxococcales bacterium]